MDLQGMSDLLGLGTQSKKKQGKEKTKLAQRNRAVFSRLRGGSWKKWREYNLQKSYDFFLGDQISKEKLDELRTVGMPDFIVNKITPGIELLKYFITANKPGYLVAGVDGSDSKIAHVHSAILSHLWDISNGGSIFGQSIQDALTKSVGYLFVDIDPNSDRGNGDPKFYTLPPEEVFPDPSSRHILYDDASFIEVKKDFTKGYLKNALPDYKNIIDKASGDDEHLVTYSSRDTDDSGSIQIQDVESLVTTQGTDEEVIDYYEFYEKENVKFVTVTVRKNVTQEDIQAIQKNVEKRVEIYKEELSVQLQDMAISLKDELNKGNISQERYEFELKKAQRDVEQSVQQYRNLELTKAVSEFETVDTYNIREAEYDVLKEKGEFKDRIVDVQFYWETRIKLTVSVGSDTFLYQSILPLRHYPVIPIPYLHTGTIYPMSLVQLVIGKQQEINKAHQIMIHNANLSGSMRWLTQHGSITNVEDWEQDQSRPGGTLFYNRGYEKPIPIQPLPLSNAFFTVVEKGENILEETMGALPFMQGDPGAGPETYRGLLAMDEFGTRRIRSWTSNVVEPALERLAHVLTQYAQYLYKSHKVIRIVNPDTSEWERLEINVPIYDDFGKVVKEKYFDYQATEFDIRIISGRTFPVNRWAERDEYFKYLQAGVIDDIAFLSKTDITNKEQIIKRKSLYAQLTQENESLKNQIKSLNGSIETFKRELEHAGIKDQVSKASAEISRAVANVKSDFDTAVEKHKTALKRIQDEANLELKRVKKQATTDKSKKKK